VQAREIPCGRVGKAARLIDVPFKHLGATHDIIAAPTATRHRLVAISLLEYLVAVVLLMLLLTLANVRPGIGFFQLVGVSKR
jgi:hypothetical protein